MLDEIKLLVDGGNRKVIPYRRLIRALSPERRVREDDVVLRRAGHLVDRVAERDLRRHVVEVQVHEREAARPRDEVLSEVGLRPNPLRGRQKGAEDWLQTDQQVLGLSNSL